MPQTDSLLGNDNTFSLADFSNGVTSIGQSDEELTKKPNPNDITNKVNPRECAEDRYKAALMSMGYALVLTDRNGKIEMANKPALDLLGYEEDELVNQVWPAGKEMLTEGGEKILEKDLPIMRTLKTGERIDSRHHKLVRKDDTVLTVSYFTSPVIEGGKITGAVIVFRDTSMEEEIDTMKSEFVALASHQLRTPLTAIKLFTELLLDPNTGSLNTTQFSYLQYIDGSTARMSTLVSELLNLSKIESGGLQVEPQPNELMEVVGDIVKEQEAFAEASKCKINVQKVGDHSTIVDLDPTLFRQVLKNLVVNAVKYSGQGERNVDVIVKMEGDTHIVSVKDYGPGVSDEDKAKMFTKFFRAESAIRADPEGSGLGLYVSKSVAFKTGCRLWFESKVGDGTTFYFAIPRSGMMRRDGDVTLISV